MKSNTAMGLGDITLNDKPRTFDNDIKVRFGERLKKAMNGLSNVALAKKCNTSEKIIRDYISGKTAPTLERLITLSEVCNVSLSWLATGDEDNCNSNNYKENKKETKHVISNELSIIINRLTHNEQEFLINFLIRNGIKSLMGSKSTFEEKNPQANLKETPTPHHTIMAKEFLNLPDDVQREILQSVNLQKSGQNIEYKKKRKEN